MITEDKLKEIINEEEKFVPKNRDEQRFIEGYISGLRRCLNYKGD